MLSNQQLQDIEQLQKECESFDQLQLKLNWEMLRNRESHQLDLFHYENEELVAFFALYVFGSTVEVCGMVKPSERRKGHFQRLFEQGMKIIAKNTYKKILLNAPAGSDGAIAFLNKQGAKYALTEHQMEWQEGFIEEVKGVTLRKAMIDDLDMCVRLTVEAFGEDEEDAKVMEIGVIEDTDTSMLMIEVNEEIVGKIRLYIEADQAWIYGFAILREQRGKGIGRKVLRQIIRDHRAAGHSVHLEVETSNAYALGLYESVGFKVVHAQDYYTYEAMD